MFRGLIELWRFATGEADTITFSKPKYDPGVMPSTSVVQKDVEMTFAITDPQLRVEALVNLCEFALEKARLDDVVQGLWLLSHYRGDVYNAVIPCDENYLRFIRQKPSEEARRQQIIDFYTSKLTHSRFSEVDHPNVKDMLAVRANTKFVLEMQKALAGAGEPLEMERRTPDLYAALKASFVQFPESFMQKVFELSMAQVKFYNGRYEHHGSHEERLKWVRSTREQRYENVEDREIFSAPVFDKESSVCSGPASWYR